MYSGSAGQGSDFAPGFDVKNYSQVVWANFPTANVDVAAGIRSPTIREFTIALGRQLGQSGHIKATYAWRTTSNFVDDFIDLSTGVTNVPLVGTLSNRVFSNTDQPTREYQALIFQTSYRPRSAVMVGGDYTSTTCRGEPSAEGCSAVQVIADDTGGSLQSSSPARRRPCCALKNRAQPTTGCGAVRVTRELPATRGTSRNRAAGRPTLHSASTDCLNAVHPGASADPLGFDRRGGVWHSLVFLSMQHSLRIATEDKTRRALGGPFWKDYITSVKGLRGWDDGGKIFTNYLAHPAQGAVTGHTWVQHDNDGKRMAFSFSWSYWVGRLQALAWTAAWSTQFELGPLSEASIGNVGLRGRAAYVDLVVTPLGGTAFLIVEELVDRYFVEWLERKTPNRFLRALARGFGNPARSVANISRFKTPWYRDARPIRAPTEATRP